MKYGQFLTREPFVMGFSLEAMGNQTGNKKTQGEAGSETYSSFRTEYDVCLA